MGIVIVCIDGDVQVGYVIVFLSVYGSSSHITVHSYTRLPIYSKILTSIKPFELTAPYVCSQLHDKLPLNKMNSSGIYKLKCKTCNNLYVGQTGKSIKIRYREHTGYIKTSNPTSAYALHILNNEHEYGNADQIIQLQKRCNKGKKTKCWESFYMQIFQQQTH